jgi:hypothetical protein
MKRLFALVITMLLVLASVSVAGFEFSSRRIGGGELVDFFAFEDGSVLSILADRDHSGIGRLIIDFDDAESGASNFVSPLPGDVDPGDVVADVCGEHLHIFATLRRDPPDISEVWHYSWKLPVSTKTIYFPIVCR